MVYDMRRSREVGTEEGFIGGEFKQFHEGTKCEYCQGAKDAQGEDVKDYWCSVSEQ